MSRLCLLAVLVLLVFASCSEGSTVKSGKVYTNQTLPNDPGCFQVAFKTAFNNNHDVRVIVSISQSNDQQPISNPASLWVKQVSSSGFTVCVRESVVRSNDTVVINWFSIQGTVYGVEQGDVVFDQWGAGTQCKTVQPQNYYSRPLHVLATLMSEGSEYDDMGLWLTKNNHGGAFAICMRERINFAGIHRRLKVNWIAFDEKSNPFNFTESKTVFLTDRHLVDSTFCRKVNFTSSFFAPPVVTVTASYYSNDSRPVTQTCKAMTTWIEEVTRSYFRICARQIPGQQYRDEKIGMNYIVHGDLDPCTNVSCGYFAVCKAFAPYDARCVCVVDCPTYEEQVCSSNGTTFDNRCYYELEMCRRKSNHSLHHPGSCRGFPLEKGRDFWISHSGDITVCKDVKFRSFAFYPDKQVHVHVTVNHINTTNPNLVHDATASWVELVTYQGFMACVTTAGRGESARAAQTSFDWLAYQGAPDGGVTDRTRMNDWWTGTSCKTVQLPKGKFQTEPTVIVTAEHISAAFKHDAANIWLEKVNKTSFQVCLRELQNFDGLHQDIHVNWIAFDEVHRPLFSEKRELYFANRGNPSMKYSGAFCKDIKYTKSYSQVPLVILSANHTQDTHGSKPVCDGVSTWIEYMNTTGFRVCVKELYTSKYEPLTVTYLILSDICDPEWKYFEGVCFKTSSSCDTWINSENQCRSSQAHLATIRTQRENVFVQQQLNGEKGWFGLNDRSVEGDFRWSSKLRGNWTYWAHNQPNNAGNQDCVHTLGFHYDYRWNDVSCNACHNFTCAKDMDECSIDQHGCHGDAICTNTYGSHTCQCKTGFSGDGQQCTDIDECASSPCDVSASCTNVPGSHICQCNAGYSGDGYTCTDIDECQSSNQCHSNADCTNTPGSYSCKCKLRYHGDGITCTAYTYRGLDNSAILSGYGNNNYFQDLTNYLSPVLQDSSKSHWVKCWRAATDGWDTAATFHPQCDHKGPTVTLVRVGSYIFGGYSEVSWDSSSDYTYASTAFLFSLYNSYGYYPIKRTLARYHSSALYRNSGYGPTFGNGHDMYICNYASSSGSSYFYIVAYHDPPGCSYGNYCGFYTGSGTFTPSDIEVFYETTN